MNERPHLHSLVKTISELLGLPRSEVDLHARRLREAGHLPAAAMGIRRFGGGAPVKPRHAAALLVSLLLAPNAQRAPQTVRVHVVEILAITKTIQAEQAGAITLSWQRGKVGCMATLPEETVRGISSLFHGVRPIRTAA